MYAIESKVCALCVLYVHKFSDYTYILHCSLYLCVVHSFVELSCAPCCKLVCTVFFKKCVFTCTYVCTCIHTIWTDSVHMAWLEGEDRRKVGGREGEGWTEVGIKREGRT